MAIVFPNAEGSYRYTDEKASREGSGQVVNSTKNQMDEHGWESSTRLFLSYYTTQSDTHDSTATLIDCN